MTNLTPEYDSDGDGTVEADVDNDSVNTDELHGSWDRRVSSTSDLESLPSDIQSGETVRIEQPDTPFRPASWPDGGKYADIDVSNARIVCESPFAGDGQALVKPADGSDIGGLLVGSGTTTIQDVHIKDWGWDGNESTMDSTVKRLHGLTFDNADFCSVKGGFYTETHPASEHNSGGSGITVRKDATRIFVDDVKARDIGDRFVQMAGTGVWATRVRTKDGYDRSVSLNVTHPDGLSYIAQHAAVHDVVAETNTDGSVVGVAGGQERTGRGGYHISKVLAYGTHRSAVTLRTGRDATVSHIYSFGGGSGSDPAIDFRNSFSGEIVANNLLARDAAADGLYLGDSNKVHVSDFAVINAGGTGLVATGAECSVQNGRIVSSSAKGVDWAVGDGQLGPGLFIDQSGDEGMNLQNTGIPYDVIGNRVRTSDQNSNGANEIQVNAQNSLIGLNQIAARSGSNVFSEGANASKNLYIGNRAPDAIANMFDSLSATSWGYANFPALFTSEGSVTLTGGTGSGSECARISGVDATEGLKPSATVTPDPGSSQPAADYSWDSYLEWDDSAGNWDLVVEWRTDPGSNVSALYEVTREPTSRAIKGL